MLKNPVSDHLVRFDKKFKLADAPTRIDRKGHDDKRALKDVVERIAEQQQKLYAHDRYSLLLVFQAMDAAGKDSTIRAILSGVNPAGCHVTSFKKPSANEIDHDFLWRTTKALPERGRIGVFNRSHYEEVLIVRVRPKILGYQRLPDACVDTDVIWQERLESVADQEKHLARNGTVILKFWLNVSREEQHERFKARLDDVNKNWKFSEADLDESERWDDYMRAYEDALNQTSKPWAPWYAIPADSKRYMRYRVASIVAETLESLPLKYPAADDDLAEREPQIRQRLIT